jgi:hypothetical protein
MLGPMLTTIHNLHYYLNLMQEVRDALDAGRPAARAGATGCTCCWVPHRWIYCNKPAKAWPGASRTGS